MTEPSANVEGVLPGGSVPSPGDSAPERPASGHHGPEHHGPERYGPERYGPERYGPERYGPERYGPERPGLEQRSAVLLVAGFATVLLASALAFVPVPYAIFRAGPVLNTLGSVDGKRLITVEGRQSYPPTGTLDMTTVRVSGGPGSRLSLYAALAAWLSDSRAAVPEEAVFPPGLTEQESRDQDIGMMITSQQSATAAALGALNIPVPTTLNIAGISPDVPAAKVLQPKDVVVKVNGTVIKDLTQLRAVLQRTEAGSEVTITVRRGGVDRDVVTRTTRGEDGQTLLGVFLDPKFKFPFEVKINIPDVSGPSAGMVFALGIIDNLTPGDITGGKNVAGTGTIDADGSVGPIGGIQQKLVGARNAGAEYFLAPSRNCDEVRDHVPDGLQVVKVATLTDARRAMEAIATDKAGSLPAC